MSEPFATLPFMGIRRLFLLFVLVLVAAGCGGGSDENVSATTVPLTVPSTSSTSSTTTPTGTATTTTVLADEDTSASSNAPEDDEEHVSSVVTDGQIPEGLTWATEDTAEADIERAFWIANTSRREAIEANNPDLEAFVESHTGRELDRLLEAFVSSEADGVTYLYPEPTETLIEFITLVTPTEALMQVCELERSEYYISGELNDGRDFDSQFQARFVLGDDSEWRWEERIKLTFEPLEGDAPTCWNS